MTASELLNHFQALGHTLAEIQELALHGGGKVLFIEEEDTALELYRLAGGV